MRVTSRQFSFVDYWAIGPLPVRSYCVRLRKSDWDRRGILALAHRGVTHVRGKDCVHPDTVSSASG